MEFRERELAEGATHEAWQKIRLQRIQIESFFADVALRLLVQRPSKDAPQGDKTYWERVADKVSVAVRAYPDLVQRLPRDRVMEFRDDEAEIRRWLSDVGQATIGYLFLYRHRPSRHKVYDLIDRVAPAWIESLGELLWLASQLRLINNLIHASEGDPNLKDLADTADLVRSRIEFLQQDPYGADGEGRTLDWSIPMLENGVVFEALGSIVDNRAHTALRLLLVRAGFEDRSVRGKLHVSELDADDWMRLKQDLGLEDIRPIKQLLESSRSAELLALVKAKSTRQDALRRNQSIQALMAEVLGPREGLDMEAIISALRKLERRLDRFQSGWHKLRRVDANVNGGQFERIGGTPTESFANHTDGMEQRLLHAAGVSPAGIHVGNAPHSSGDDEGDVEESNVSSNTDEDGNVAAAAERFTDLTALDPDVEDEEWLDRFPSDAPHEDDIEKTDIFAAIQALRELSCASQVLVYLRLSELAHVPVEGGKQRKEKEIVYAAAIDFLLRIHTQTVDPSEAAGSLCTFLCELGDQSPATKGFSVFCPDGDLASSMRDMVLSFSRVWQLEDINPAESLLDFELSHQGRVALSPGDRRKLQRLFQRAKLECTAFDGDQVHLRSLFA